MSLALLGAHFVGPIPIDSYAELPEIRGTYIYATPLEESRYRLIYVGRAESIRARTVRQLQLEKFENEFANHKETVAFYCTELPSDFDSFEQLEVHIRKKYKPRLNRVTSTEDEALRFTGSAVGGAILGGSLIGPVGAVLGCLLGALLADAMNNASKARG